MSEPRAKPFLSASRFQLALAGIMTVVFVVVLLVQFGGVAGGKPTGPPDPATRKPSTGTPPHGPHATADQPRRRPPRRPAPAWPAIDLAEVLRFDPFAAGQAFASRQKPSGKAAPDEAAAGRRQRRQQAQSERAEAVERLRRQGLKAVIAGSGGQAVAVVGSKTVRVGDVIDGLRVIAIQPDGVVLEPTEIE